MSATFLVNGDCRHSYSQLLHAVCTDGYVACLRTHNLFDYFSNLVKALANNQPLVLLDADINVSEVTGVSADDVNVISVLSAKKFSDMSEVIDALQRSTSKITIFTSGTTGQPKKVVHSVQTLTRSVRLGARYANQVWAYAYNPTHMAGLQVFFQAFENVNTLVNVFNATRSVVYQMIEEHGVTHISATPTFYRLLLPVERALSSVQRVTLGGEKSDQRLYDAIHQIFPLAKINNVYASTEAGSLFAAKGDCFQIPAAIADKIKVVDDELLVHCSLLGKSDSFSFDADYYHTGDIIEWVDSSVGIFRFKSRKNELINVGGYKVNPGEVEDVINSIDGVRQALVYGKPNSVLGNVLCAEVLLDEGAALTELDIRKALRDKLQDFKIPRRIKFVDSFTLTRTGKLKRV